MTTSTPKNRNAARLCLVVAEEHVETNPLYARDIDGDGKEERWCNLFAAVVTGKLNAPLPMGMRANELHAWLAKQSFDGSGWEKSDAHAAQAMADQGCVAVASWANPIPGDSGHIAVVMPSLGEAGVWAAQAGRVKFTRDLLQRGFGAIAPDFWVHP